MKGGKTSFKLETKQSEDVLNDDSYEEAEEGYSRRTPYPVAAMAECPTLQVNIVTSTVRSDISVASA